MQGTASETQDLTLNLQSAWAAAREGLATPLQFQGIQASQAHPEPRPSFAHLGASGLSWPFSTSDDREELLARVAIILQMQLNRQK